MSLELELKTGAEKYTRCYYSVNNGSYMVGNVSLSHLKWNSTDALKARLDKIELDFMNDVKKRCNGVIANYESMNVEYRQVLNEAATTSWITFLIGGKQTDGSQVESLEVLRCRTGDALSYFVFTRQDVEKYFSQRLGNG